MDWVVHNNTTTIV